MRKNRNKNKMNTAKLGVIFIVAAMALAGIGAGYSAWFDTITVEGTVGTGSVGWEVIDESETHVWKIHGLPQPYNPDWGNEIYVDYAMLSEAEIQAMFPGLFIEEISSSYVTVSADKHAVIVTYDNLFPCIWFKTDIVIKYTGTVPGKINDIFYEPTGGIDWIAPLIASNDIYATARDEQGNVVEIGYQLHENDLIYIELWVHIPQEQDLMLKSGGFTASFEVVQWNEYPYEGGECGEDPPIGYHADVSLCMDRSGSIVYPLPDNSAVYRTAAKAFVDAVLDPDDGMMALSSFATTGSGDHALTIDGATLKGLIDAMSFTGSTNLKEGIEYAHTYLTTEPAGRDDDSTYPDYMVIITDGHPNQPGTVAEAEAAAIVAANAAKAHGITIIVLGMGNNVNGAWLENNIASTGYYYAGDWAGLQALLESIVGT